MMRKGVNSEVVRLLHMAEASVKFNEWIVSSASFRIDQRTSFIFLGAVNFVLSMSQQ